MLFRELRNVLNRHEGHNMLSIWIGRVWHALIDTKSNALEFFDDYEVYCISSSMTGNIEMSVADIPCIKIVLKEKEND